MKIFAVIDTNVIVSALLKKESNPGKVVVNTLAGIITPVYSKEIIVEYNEVLHRKKFKFSNEVIDSIIQAIIKNGKEFFGIPTEEKPSDPDDIVFYEVTMDSRQTDETFLVTGNIKDFPIKPFIVRPEEMMRIVEERREKEK